MFGFEKEIKEQASVIPQVPIHENSETHLAAPSDTATEGKIMKSKWQYIVASVVGLTGAFFGGVFGGFVSAFAGDSWWNSDVALKLFQYTIAFGGACLGAVPGTV